MLVKDVIAGIEAGRITIKQLTEKYKCSDRTVQLKIKKLGFYWIAKEGKYNHDAVPEESYNLEFDDLFTHRGNTRETTLKAVTGHPVQSEKDVKTVDKDVQAVTGNKQSQKEIVATVEASEREQEGEYSKLDYLLFGGQQQDNNRTYKGYYIDNDLLAVIDNVKAGSKSDLINECLRYVFKQKGIL